MRSAARSMERSTIHPISCSGDDRVPPRWSSRLETPASPRRGFSFGERHPAAFMPGLCVGDREARADCQCGELIDRIAAGAPVRELLVVEAFGHARVPFAGHRPHHRAGVELAAIDAHRAAEAAADLERRLDDGVAREARRDRFEIRDFTGGLRRAIPFLLVRSGGVRKVLHSMRKTVPPALIPST